MAKNGNTNVTSLPLIAQLRVRSMATKCAGTCGACVFCQSCAQVECATLISDALEPTRKAA